MKISFDHKGDFSATRDWLERVSKKDPTKTLSSIADEGTKSLSRNTPRATGETASSWKSKVTQKGNRAEISWTNYAHPEAGVSIAKLIDIGHGTRTGGYVPPKPYIKGAMTPVWVSLDRLVKELIK